MTYSISLSWTNLVEVLFFYVSWDLTHLLRDFLSPVTLNRDEIVPQNKAYGSVNTELQNMHNLDEGSNQLQQSVDFSLSQIAFVYCFVRNSHAHSFMYCLWLFCPITAELNSCNKDLMAFARTIIFIIWPFIEKVSPNKGIKVFISIFNSKVTLSPTSVWA